jgi:Rhodopirellula transposase DDE domain
MIGLFKNNGRTWREKPKQVNDHDFRTDAIGVALPYGIYDVSRNTGMVMVGTTRETPEGQGHLELEELRHRRDRHR